ncbi:anhydro-N-acetylmuramic acid kinase, partial [Acinetobacter baumannii]|uniref:anhydro-N-acetylmuramic acid kinase n=1 Tax=Acinetobacter baumannii TaxID=470 RepID=UPI0034D6181B
MADAERLVTRAPADAVENFFQTNHLSRDAVAVVGFHGPTVLHRPEQKLTMQIGDGRA